MMPVPQTFWRTEHTDLSEEMSEMSFFENRNDDDYARAANAVRGGNPTREQRELNDRAAKQAGTLGNRARAAKEGKHY